jgi:hypothetical protein
VVDGDCVFVVAVLEWLELGSGVLDGHGGLVFVVWSWVRMIVGVVVWRGDFRRGFYEMCLCRWVRAGAVKVKLKGFVMGLSGYW